MMVEYVRKGGKRRKATVNGSEVLVGGKKIGVMVAIPVDDNTIHVSWAKCHQKLDKFTDLGVNIAKERALKGRSQFVPRSMEENIKKFVERVKRYYKDKRIVEIFEIHHGALSSRENV